MNKGWTNSYSWVNEGWSNGNDWMNKGWSNDSGCFITTAAVEYMGLTDDCSQLQLLRAFRDKLVEEDPEIRKLVLEYYEVAPTIVREISKSPNRDKELDDIFHNMVEPVVNSLNSGDTSSAIDLYKQYYLSLKKKYVPQSN